MQYKNKKASILLIVSFLFLIMLFSVAMTLIFLSRTATKETVSYKDKIMAQLIATSGVFFASAERIDNAKNNLFDTPYDKWYFKREYFFDNNDNGYFDFQDTFLYSSDQNGNGVYDSYVSVEETLNPSYKWEKGGILIYLPTNEVTIQVPSGALPLKEKWLQFYKLKVIDNSSTILINYPVSQKDKNELSDSVVRMLNNLGEIVVVSKTGRKINQMHPLKLGDRIRQIRKLGPIKFKEELTYDKYGNLKFSQDEFLAIKDFISTSMWRDPRTYYLNSVPYYLPPEGNISKEKKEVYYFSPLFKKNINHKSFLSMMGICPGFLLERGAENAQNLTRFSDHLNNNYGAEEQSTPKRYPLVKNPQIEFEMRAPININTAPREVLIAMFMNLQAYYYDKTEKTYVNPGKIKLTSPISLNTAVLLADYIISYRAKNIFRNFKDFQDFILGKKTLADFDLSLFKNREKFDATLSFLTDIEKKVILANADPDPHIYEFNPDRIVGVIFEDISKPNLVANTTEITFFSHGYYEIESLGFVVREYEDVEKTKKQREAEKFYIGMLESKEIKKNPYIRPQVFKEKHYSEKFYKLLAIEKVVSNVSLYDTVKLSTQADFVKEYNIYQGDSVITVELPSSQVNIKGLELFPENLHSGAALDYSKAANYDGYITLKPLTIPIWNDREDRLVFQADLIDSFKAQKAAFKKYYGTAYQDRSLLDIADITYSSFELEGKQEVLDYTKSSLMPDGFFIHEAKRPNYEYCTDKNVRDIESSCKYGYINKNNAESYIYYKSFHKDKWSFPQKGYMEMWFKPSWNVEDQEISWEGSDTRTFFSMGDSRGITANNQIMEIRETRQVGLLDPEEIAQAIAATIPNVNRIVIEAPPGIRDIISRVRQRFARGLYGRRFAANRSDASDDIESTTYTIRYSVVVNSQTQIAPLERFAFFARNRELAVFIGNNFSSFSNVDTFGNLRKTSIPLGGSWKAGTWHHIAFKWYGSGKTVRVFLDGKPSTNIYKPQFILNNINSMFFGSNRFRQNKCNGFPLNADGTISSIRIYDYPNIVSSGGFAIPDKYNPNASISKKNAYIESYLFPYQVVKRFANHKLFAIVLNGTIDESLDVDIENQYGGFCVDLIVGNFTYENVACYGKFHRNPPMEVVIKSENSENRYVPPAVLQNKEEPLNLSFIKGWIKTDYLKLKEVGSSEIKYRVKFESPRVFPLLTTPVLDNVIFFFLRSIIVSSTSVPLPGKL